MPDAPAPDGAARRPLWIALCLTVAVITGLVGARMLNPLPPIESREPSTAYSDTADTFLGRAIEPLAGARPGRSGVEPLASGRDAFAARVLLARAAERSIDVQYYIWNRDTTGTLMFAALRDAADRGVRVRMLLDDNKTVGLDRVLAALDAHANIEVRLFNPFTIRRMRWLAYVTDFPRLNRRMHNKSFTVDNQATIIGGRNIGDEYFNAVEQGELVFTDLDVMAVGPIVQEVSRDFDAYWASESSYPAERLLPRAGVAELDALHAAAWRLEQDRAAAAYVARVRELPFVTELLEGRLELEWTKVAMVSDDPAKGLGRVPWDALLRSQVIETMGAPRQELDLVSPYFVPTETGVEAFAALVADGVRVRVLINSLEATDVDAVHAGYIKHRKSLLRAGIELYEMRMVSADAEPAQDYTGPFGSGASSLHAKTFAADRERIFIGSFNFDQRSIFLNTELGFVIESSTLAGRLAGLFDESVPERAYEARLSPSGEVFWIEHRDGEPVRHDTEPGATLLQRSLVRVLSWMPIDSLL